MVGQSSFHCRSDTQCLVNATEVVMEEIQRNLMPVVFKFLTESVRQASEAAHTHTHRQVLPFYVTRRDMFRIGIPAQHSSAAPDTRCWTVARFPITRCAVKLNQHRVVDLRTKGRLNRLSVDAMAVRR